MRRLPKWQKMSQMTNWVKLSQMSIPLWNLSYFLKNAPCVPKDKNLDQWPNDKKCIKCPNGWNCLSTSKRKCNQTKLFEYLHTRTTFHQPRITATRFPITLSLVTPSSGIKQWGAVALSKSTKSRSNNEFPVDVNVQLEGATHAHLPIKPNSYSMYIAS